MTRTLADLPGPRRLPALGNALAVRPTTLHAVAERWSETYGPLFRFDLGRKPVIAIADATLINQILRERPQGYRRWSEIGQVLTEVGADGVFAAEGDGWRRQRRLAVTALNAAHIARYFSVIAVAGERLPRRLGLLAASGEPVDPSPTFSAYTVDVTSALAFG